MSALKFYAQVVRALDEVRAPYMLVGAFAGLAFGITRSTFDIDILVDLRESDFQALADRFPPPRYYADPEMMRNSTRQGIMFNLIDTEEGVKADLVPLTREPEYRVAFERRIRRWFTDPDDMTFEAWCARPEDIIIGKLQAWAEGQSNKHPSDVRNMLAFLLSGMSDVPYDLEIISVAAARMGAPVLKLWRELLAKAQADLGDSKKSE
ncbi:MAG TPA: hypothetical protein VI793_19095 [Anaerolineales bacterium]|nr:hypothetical protein [Anaerolineales bacterium]